MPRIFAYILHKGGVLDDTAAELPVAAARIDASQPPVAIVTGHGPELDTVCESLRTSYAEVWKIADEQLAYPDAELVRQALAAIVPQGSILLIPHGHFAVDLAPGLSIRMNAAYLPDLTDIFVRQEFGGQVSTHLKCDLSTGAVITIRPGAFRSQSVVGLPACALEVKPIPPLSARRRYLETVAPEAGDVDITKETVLVSIGRGIQEKDNIPLAEELAEALGAAVSCSRPVVDAKWLDKSRQVGSSGQTVRPKVYLACGISGSFQHLAGLKGNPFLVAINKNPKAPIFRVADVGIVDDLLEFLPELTARVKDEKCVAK